MGSKGSSTISSSLANADESSAKVPSKKRKDDCLFLFEEKISSSASNETNLAKLGGGVRDR